MNKYNNIMFQGLNLKEYCVKNNMSFNYIKYKLKLFENKEEGKLPIDMQIIIALHTRKTRNDYAHIKYKNQYLIDFCKENNIVYSKIADRCKTFYKNNNDISLIDEMQINIFLKRYYLKEEINKLKLLFNQLDKNDYQNYRIICENLNINYRRVIYLKNKFNMDIKNLIYIIWYSNDKKDEFGIYITNERLNDLLNKKNLQLNDYYGLYKAFDKACLNDILEYEKSYLIGFILRIVKTYNFKVYKYDYEDLINQAQLIFVKCITRNVLNQIGRIIRYIEKTVTNQMLSYLIKNYSYKYVEYDDSRKIISN